MKADSAVYYFQLARDQYLTENNKNEHYSSIFNLAFELTRVGKIEEATEMSKRALIEGKPYLEDLKLAIGYRLIAHCLNRGNELDDQVLKYYDSAQLTLKALTEEPAVKLKAIVSSDLAIFHFYNGDFLSAEKYFQRSIEILETLDLSTVAPTMIDQRMNMGAVLKIRGAYNQSIESYQAAEKIAIEHLKDPNRVIGFVLDGIAAVIQSTSNVSYNKTIEYYERAIELINKDGETHESAVSMINLALIYQGIGEEEIALTHLLKAVELCERMLGPNHIKTATSYSTLAEYYKIKGDNGQARVFYLKVLDTFARIEKKSEVLPNSLLNMAEISVREGKIKEGLDYIRRSIAYADLMSENWLQNISYRLNVAKFYEAAGLTDSAYQHCQKVLEIASQKESQDKATAFRAGILKGNLLEKKYLESNEIQHLYDALKSFEKVKPFMSQLTGGSEVFQDQISNREEVSEWNKSGFRIANRLYELTGEAKHLHQAWTFAESNKSQLILANLRESIAFEKSGVSMELINADQDISNAVTYYEQQLYQAQTNVDSAAIERLRNNLFEFRQKNDSIKNLYKTQFPEFFALRYDQSYISIQELQKKLGDHELMLSYHMGAKNLFFFEISKDEITLNQLKRDSTFNEMFDTYLSQVTQQNEKRATPKALEKLGLRLREAILPPAARLKKYKELIIIADGYLSTMPFETLPLEANNDLTHYADINFALKSISITYANSTTLFDKLNSDIQISNPHVLAFAPVFDKDQLMQIKDYDSIRSGLGALAWTQQEVNNISEHFEVMAMFGAEATERQFRNLSSDYDILHVASHGLINEDKPMFSQLVFSPFDKDSVNDGFLNTQELYNMNFKAEMVVLSACNSGSGKSVSGEGIISLANAFFYAGSKSLVMSLWTANDQSTASIIGDFYANLADGESKSMALRNAKLNYLEKADNIRSHPYYWAHLVVNGNNQPIKASSNLMLYLLLITLVVIVVAVAIKKQRALKM